MRSSTPGLITIAVGVIIAIAGLLAYPYANVWQRSMSGKAQLAEAEFNRQIKVREAAAIKDSAQALADAEITRAIGVAEANRIVADGLGGPEGYLRYLYIESLKEARRQGAQVIYVPTEAGLPILEASRLNNSTPKQ
ncbi:membrane protease subunit [Alcaligenes faecalis]|nr:membrane protease subunit [Alcaligenes faecalis]